MSPRMKRLSLLAVISVGLLSVSLLFSGSCVIKHLGGAFTKAPSDAKRGLSKKARKLVSQAFRDLEIGRIADYHVHAVALGTHVEGAFVHEGMRSLSSPIRYAKYLVYMSSAGVENEENADVEYLERLVDLAMNMPKKQKHHLLAFDKHYLPDGTVSVAKTEFYTPNLYVFELAETYPEIFVPTMSVHPYRKDALEQLEKWAARGGKMVKWLPNAMGMDPADPRIDPYYAKMKELKLVLLTHAGEEQAVESEEDQRLGNPLRLRRPLDAGVKVVVAHCASLGMSVDLDDPGGPLVSSFDLFLRLMDEEKYEGLLFGEISAMTQFNRVGHPLETMLEREDLHHRLVSGSDYPLPAINSLIHTSQLADLGFITEKERELLIEIYDYNPLLFDFVLKRTLEHPETGQRFPPSVFMTSVELGA